MAATIITNTPPYTWGQQTNMTVGRLISLNSYMERLQDAVTTATAGFGGTPGTQFEIGNATNGTSNQNLFGVVADPENPGARGTDYSYAVNELHAAWATFWAAATPYIEQLDNGVMTM